MRVVAAVLLLIGLGFLGAGVYRELGGADDARSEGLTVVEYDLGSALLGRKVRQLAVVPRDSEGRPLLVLLNDEEAGPRSLLTGRLLTRLRDLGRAAPVVLIPAGGSSGFRDGDGGRWGSHVLVEAIPDAVERFGLGERRAIGGAGTGGAAAVALARLDRRRFCAARAATDGLVAAFVRGGACGAGQTRQ